MTTKVEKTTKVEATAVVDESQKLWQEYLQKCCEVGQLLHALEQLDGQRNDLEKNVEVTQRAVKSLAAKHRELTQKKLTAEKAQVSQ